MYLAKMIFWPDFQDIWNTRRISSITAQCDINFYYADNFSLYCPHQILLLSLQASCDIVHLYCQECNELYLKACTVRDEESNHGSFVLGQCSGMYVYRALYRLEEGRQIGVVAI